MPRTRANRPPFDPFNDFDHMFEDMRRQMDEMLRQMGASGPLNETLSFHFTSSNGLDDRTRLEPIGRRAPVRKRPEPPVGHENEPLIDVWENEKKVTVLVELPGIAKDDIDIEADGKMLRLSVNTDNKVFDKEIALPCNVRSSSATANYRNGVLEVSLDRTAPRKRKRPKVKVS